MSEEELKQTGGDGYTFNMGENVGGLPAVEGYNCCDGAAPPTAPADATNQVGGGVNPFNFIINPETGARMSLFSSGGKALLKNLIKLYKAGGAPKTGGAPAELPGAFGEDYFNTEADALKGEW